MSTYHASDANAARTNLITLCSICLVVATLTIAPDALAQSRIAAAGRAAYTEVYTWVSILGGIAITLTGINWAWGDKIGTGNPKAWFLGAVIGTAIGLGSPDIIMWLKGMFSSSPSQV